MNELEKKLAAFEERTAEAMAKPDPPPKPAPPPPTAEDAARRRALETGSAIGPATRRRLAWSLEFFQGIRTPGHPLRRMMTAAYQQFAAEVDPETGLAYSKTDAADRAEAELLLAFLEQVHRDEEAQRQAAAAAPLVTP